MGPRGVASPSNGDTSGKGANDNAEMSRSAAAAAQNITNMIRQSATPVSADAVSEDRAINEKISREILNYYDMFVNRNTTASPASLSPTATWIEILSSVPTLCTDRIPNFSNIESLLQLRRDLLDYGVPSRSRQLHQIVRTELSRRIVDHVELRPIATPQSLTTDLLVRSSVHQSLMHRPEMVQRMFQDFSIDNGKRVFGLYFHNEPVAVLYVSLQSRIPASLHDVLGVHRQPDEHGADADGTIAPSSGKIIVDENRKGGSSRVATFYSIVANLQPALSGIGLGEHLIHQAVDCLRESNDCGKAQDVPSVFVTLSPMPGFRTWLTRTAQKMASSCQPQDALATGFSNCDNDTNASLQVLAQAWNCPIHEVLGTMIAKLQQAREATNRQSASTDDCNLLLDQHEFFQDSLLLDDGTTIEVQAAMDELLLHMATFYVFSAKRDTAECDSDVPMPPLPLDGVTRFHVSNGASVYRINLRGDSTDIGWTNSFGVMVNYRYDDIDQLPKRQTLFRSTHVVPRFDCRHQETEARNASTTGRLPTKRGKKGTSSLYSPEEWAEIIVATKGMTRDERKAYLLNYKTLKRLTPVDLATRLRKLLHTATRGGAGSHDDRQEALHEFAALYPRLNRNQRDMVLAYVADRYTQRAYHDFFPRILQIPLEGADGAGLLWTLQFRADVLAYMRSISTRQSKTQVEGQRSDHSQQEKLSSLSNHIRYRISEHFMEVSAAENARGVADGSANFSSDCHDDGKTTAPLLDCTLLDYNSLSATPANFKALQLALSNNSTEVPLLSSPSNTDLIRQLFGPTKRVFGWYLPTSTKDAAAPPSLPRQVSGAEVGTTNATAIPPTARPGVLGVVLFASLQPTIPYSLQEIYDHKASDDSFAFPVVAFYAISHVYSKLRALGIGELVTHRAIRRLQQQGGSLVPKVFVTLSPIYDLKQWLFRKENASTVESTILSATQSEPVRELTQIWNCAPNEIYSRLQALLTRNYAGYKAIVDLEPRLEAAINKILLRAAAYYLVETKTPRGNPVDNVARFHIHNGASVYRINLNADLSDEGWRNSCGIMVNYRYDLSRSSFSHQARASTEMVSSAVNTAPVDPLKTFPVGESVIQWLTPPPPEKKQRRVLLGTRRRRPPLGILSQQHTWRRASPAKETKYNKTR